MNPRCFHDLGKLFLLFLLEHIVTSGGCPQACDTNEDNDWELRILPAANNPEDQALTKFTKFTTLEL